MRILLTGKNGQLGRCFQDVLKDTNHELFAYGSAELNIADAQQVETIIQTVKPDILVNAAAYTAVDKAETDSENAYLVNATGPELLAKQTAALNIPLIHVSTDYVFDGAAVEPYLPTDPTNPQGVYGASKLAGELNLAAACEKYIILRTAWVFSEYGNNFVKTMVRLAKERDELSVVADQYGCPTYAGDLAKAILCICEQYEQSKPLAWGTYHYCGDTPTSWHGFARAIFALAKEQKVISTAPKLTAISSCQYPTPAKRPGYSVLDCESLDDIGLVKSDWTTSLNKVLLSV
ncbi:dTDP-4-dehydrorhamnose reductase [Kangiella sp.]|uniref:dTDP-4-dehydrorhamnose reductase n=1 Tax=Kangiella sp. TaxID=1920245 RepID=UPI003A95125C